MISNVDFTRNLKVLRALYGLKMFPMKIIGDDANKVCALRELRERNRKMLWMVFILACIHSLYLQAGLVQYIIENGLTMRYELALNLNIGVASIFVCWWYWIYLCRQPVAAAEMMNMFRKDAGKLPAVVSLNDGRSD